MAGAEDAAELRVEQVLGHGPVKKGVVDGCFSSPPPSCGEPRKWTDRSQTEVHEDGSFNSPQLLPLLQPVLENLLGLRITMQLRAGRREAKAALDFLNCSGIN